MSDIWNFAVKKDGADYQFEATPKEPNFSATMSVRLMHISTTLLRREEEILLQSMSDDQLQQLRNSIAKEIGRRVEQTLKP